MPLALPRPPPALVLGGRHDADAFGRARIVRVLLPLLPLFLLALRLSPLVLALRLG